jgi:hypothetical protein
MRNIPKQLGYYELIVLPLSAKSAVIPESLASVVAIVEELKPMTSRVKSCLHMLRK